jgi:hypothetical protein
MQILCCFSVGYYMIILRQFVFGVREVALLSCFGKKVSKEADLGEALS